MRWSVHPLFSINPASLTLGILLLVVMGFFSGIPILDLIELKTYDLRLLSRSPMRPSPAVVLALIDEKSLDTEGRWPWPRSKMAALVDFLSQDGAKVIGFDIGFLEPEEDSQLAFLNELSQHVEALGLQHTPLTDLINDRKVRANSDVALATALKNSSAAVVLGYFFHMQTATLDYYLAPHVIEEQLNRIMASKYPFVLSRGPHPESAPFFRAYTPESNLDLLTAAATASGYFNLRSDQDGTARWMPLIIQAGEELFPPLAVLCAWHYLGTPPMTVRVGPYGVEGVQMGQRVIPTDENGQLLINYLGPPKTFRHVSISDILRGQLAPGTFTDKIVLVGATAVGIHDLRPAPTSPLFPGVEVHATVIDNILTQNFLARPRWSKIFDVLAIVLLGILSGVALPRLGALQGLLYATGLFVLHLGVAYWLFVHSHVWLNIVYPLLALAANYTGLTVYDYVTEERERQKIKGAFMHYVAPVVIEAMLKDPGRLQLGGEEKVLTVLFSDLQGFTSYSERYTPHQLIDLLSEYYARMTEQIFAYEGMLKEYVGDELVAIFGAPLEQADHAARACAAALAMRQHRNALRAEWASLGRPPLLARTGINSGLMLVGNIGSKYRFTYGVLGDHVNLCSRLEGLNRLYGTEILIAEHTAQLVANAFLLRELDTVRVLGREQPVRIYELLDRADAPLSRDREKALGSYAAGLQAYRQRRWQEARWLFQESVALWQNDGPSRLLAERCWLYQAEPPPEEWDGVYDLLQK